MLSFASDIVGIQADRSRLQSESFFNLPDEVKEKIACVRGPHPQRGWSRVGSEQTSKLRKENIQGRNADELTDARV
jgi:isopenicillin N synthase-like dioxygenase